MRARWVILIAGGVVVLAAAALLLPSKSAGVVVRILEQTNINGRAFRMVLVSNGTESVHGFDAWSQYAEAPTIWKRETLDHTGFALMPRSAQLTMVVMPTNEKPCRLTLLCAPHHTSDWAYWRDRVVMLFGQNPSRAYKMYIPIE